MRTILKLELLAVFTHFIFTGRLLAEPAGGENSKIESTGPADSIVQLTADMEGLSQLSPEELPRYGTYWWALPGKTITLAPTPFYPPLGDWPVYSIAGDSFLVDMTLGQSSLEVSKVELKTKKKPSDRKAAVLAEAQQIADVIEMVQEYDAEQQFAYRMTVLAVACGMKVPDGGFAGDGSDEEFYGGKTKKSNVEAHDNQSGATTNLWLSQMVVANGWLNTVASNTIGDVEYEIQSCTNLAQADWQSEGFVYGSETTNWTALSVAQNGRPVLFLRLKSWATDASGIPLWWQSQYFGTNGVDPYGNPAGDGYDNYYKFENQLNPNQFYTPAAPQAVSVLFNVSSNRSTISWLPARGSVTGYTLEKTDSNPDLLSPTVHTYSLAANATNFNDNVSGDEPDYFNGGNIDVSYRLWANYAGGSSAVDGPTPLQSGVISGNIIATNGTRYLAIFGLPLTAVTVRLSGIDSWDSEINQDLSDNYFYDIPVSDFNGGLFQIPATWQLPDTDPAGFQIYQFVQSLDAAGDEDAADMIGEVSSPAFHDGRRQLKDNLIFQLRVATTDQPLWFREGDPYLDPLFYTNPVDHVCASFFDMSYYYQEYGNGNVVMSFYTSVDENWPYIANYKYRNFVYDSAAVGSDGRLKTGLTSDFGWHFLFDPPTNQFQVPSSSWTTIASVLGTNQTRWLVALPLGLQNNSYYSSTMGQIGMQFGPTAGYMSMQSGVQNVFGLPLVSTLVTGGSSPVTLTPGGSTLNQSYFYTEAAQPQLQTAEYDFWQVSDYTSYFPIYEYDGTNRWPGNIGSPEMPGFAVTNQSQMLFLNVGGQMQLAGYAKMAVQNGYSGVYAYLGQYFDQSYTMTNGAATTNATGILSPYGNFFATASGDAALVTMPDVDTGARGTGIVHCVSLNVDKNHDGIMDLSWNGADATSQASPMVCWVNNGYTVAGTAGGADQDLPLPPNHPEYANYVGGKVTCQRDLENFFRLWICGVPQLPSSQGYSVTFSMTALSGNPAINLYSSSDSAGGTGYLTDTNVAADQARTTLSPNPEFGVALATINSQQSYTLPSNFFDYNYPYYSRFLFEGAGIGLGQLTLTITDNNGNVLCQSSVWLDLHDVKDLYEQTHITKVATTYPAMVNSTDTSGFDLDQELTASPGETNQMIVFVHGWRMSQFDYYSFSESMFKRLYWAGYQGRFASLRWPTLSADTTGDISQYFTYNRSEHIAFDSAVGASAYFDSLKARLPNYSINVAAHSMGNIVMMEALKNQLAEGHTAIDNYVLMQAAVPAHCYDTSLANYNVFTTAETSHPTPDVYRGYPGSINGALNGQMINFFNTNDYALATGKKTIIDIGGASITVAVNWEANEVNSKPDTYWSYTSDGTNAYCYYGNYRVVTNPRELMPFVSRPRSKAVGALGGVNGAIGGGELDLRANYGFDTDSQDHSAQFNWNIQKVEPFYTTILTKLFPQSP